MNQLQGDAGFDLGGVFTSPSPQQVPGAQPQMFGDQKPDPDEVAQDFVTQQLSNRPFDAACVGRFKATGFFGALGINQPGLGDGER